MKHIKLLLSMVILISCVREKDDNPNWAINTLEKLYTKPDSDTYTRWFSPENPKGEKGKGALTNKGAKGRPVFIVQPGETKELLAIEGSGIIQRMWMSGTIAKNPEQRRGVILNMYWDQENHPAVSAPIGDFFGSALGLMRSFDNELFSSPEGRSFNFTIPMPYKTGAKVEIVNESSSQVLIWYDINVQQMKFMPKDAMYFHTHWRRNPKTTLGKDFVMLPKVKGTGRFLGASIGVIGNPKYEGSWFGEGEVKIYLDGDDKHPSLVGTGTEDYIGTGWGQGIYQGQRFGSLVSNKKHDLYAFYRFHTADAVYFHKDCKVTLQQMGNANISLLRKIAKEGVKTIPTSTFDTFGQNLLNAKGKPIELIRFLDMDPLPDLFSNYLTNKGVNHYRSDDVSATTYFYLDRPSNDLPPIGAIDLRLKDMESKVWGLLKNK